MTEARLTAAHRLRPTAGTAALDRLTSLARRILDTASSQISLVTDVATTIGSAGPLPDELRGDVPLSDSMCARTVAQGRPLTVNDTRSDPATAHMPVVVAGVAGSFLGVPVLGDDRSAVGALCVFDPAPRVWTQGDVDTLQELAESVGAELELAALARDFEASRTRWDLAISSAGVGSFDWDLRTGRLFWDEALIELFGYGDDEVFAETIEAFNERVHPDDLPLVTQALQRAISSRGEFEAEYRVVLDDGSVRYVQARGRATGAGAEADRLLGAAWDVTATREDEDRAARLVEAMPIGYLRIDAAGVVLAGNDHAERLLRVHRLDLLQHVLWEAIPEAIAARLRELCVQVLATGSPATGELQFTAPIDGWLELQVVRDGGGLSLFFTDITTRRDAQAAADVVAAHDRHVAGALQQALLTRLPAYQDLELHARYVPAAAADQIGGDWYDAVVQPNGAATFVVGDVSGHDITAAATMGQLRSMLRTLIWQGDDTPAGVVGALDRAIAGLHPGALATAVVVRVEQDERQQGTGVRTVRWTNAGHLPPMLVDPDGTTRRLECTPELMLGVVPGSTRHDHTVEVAPGSTLVLYTDGLVERRDTDLDDGIGRLADSLQRHVGLPVEELVDRLEADLLDSGADDDVVVLVIRFHPPA